MKSSPGALLVRISGAWPIALFFVLPFILVLRALDTGQMLFGSDVVLSFYYNYAMVGRELANWHLPLWNPHAMCGAPLLANIQAAVFYPLTWLWALLPPGQAWTGYVVLHMGLAGCFAWLWLRKGIGIGAWSAFLGGLAYEFCGYMTMHAYAGHITMIAAYPWLPFSLWWLALLLQEGGVGRAALLGVGVAMPILAGYPMFAFFTGLFALLRLGYHLLFEADDRTKRRLAIMRVLSGLILAALFSAPQLLPTLKLTSHTQRASGTDYSFSSSYSMPPENLITFLAPGFFGDRRDGPTDQHVAYWGRWFRWEVIAFIGITTLFLALAGMLEGGDKRRWFWLGICIFGIFMALGRYAPFHKVAYHLIPGVSLFRAPGRYLLFTVLGLLPLAGMGVDRVIAGASSLRRTGLVAVALALVIAAMLILADDPLQGRSMLWQQVLASVQGDEGSTLDDRMILADAFMDDSFREAWRSLLAACVTTCVLAAVFLLRAKAMISGKQAALALSLVLAFELLSHAGRFVTGTDESKMDWPAGLADMLEDAGPYRIASVGRLEPSELTRDVGRCQMAGLDHAGGYDPMLLERYASLMNLLHGRKADDYLVGSEVMAVHPITDMLGVRFWLAHGKGSPHPAWQLRRRLGDVMVFESHCALKRAFLVPKAVVIPDRDKRLDFLLRDDFDPRTVVVLEEEPREVGQERVDCPTRVISFNAISPGAADIQVESAQGSYLLFTESWYPGWQATLDNENAPILRANHLVQAVQVPPGRHVVRMRFSCPMLFAGLVLAGLGIAGVVAASLWRQRIR